MTAKKQMLLYKKQAEVAKAVAHPIRIAIVDFLKDGEQCVCDVAARVGAERSNVSRHLSLMVSAGILEYRKDGLKVMYKLRTTCVLDFLNCVTGVLKQRAKENERLLDSF